MAKDVIDQPLPEWKDAWFTYNTLPAAQQAMLEKYTELIYKVLKKEVDTVHDLKDIYHKDSKSIIKDALGLRGMNDQQLMTPEISFIERVAYFRRFQEIRRVPKDTVFEIRRK